MFFCRQSIISIDLFNVFLPSVPNSVADPHRKNADADADPGKNLNADADSCPY
jgi:hypothetical protein